MFCVQDYAGMANETVKQGWESTKERAQVSRYSRLPHRSVAGVVYCGRRMAD